MKRAMKRALKCLAMLAMLAAAPQTARAQSQTTVTATVTDPGIIPYAGGTVKAQIQPSGPPSPCVVTGANCVPIQGTAGPATLDSTGSFTMNLYPNSIITPAATQWVFTVCIAPGVPPPQGTGPQCFSSTQTISGASQSLSAALSALAPALSTGVFNTSVPHTFGPGVAGTGAPQTFTHPTGGANNQYREILLMGDPALTFDRNLFGICATISGNNCIGTLNLGVDNDQNVVVSWNNTALAIVGQQTEANPLLIYTPIAFQNAGSTYWQQNTLANSCIFFGACNQGKFAMIALQDTGINTMACATSWNPTTKVITGSCLDNTVYNAAGAIQNEESTHIVQDTATMAAGTATVTLTAPAAFSSATTFTCTANDQTAAAAVRVVQTSGTSITFNGTTTDVVRFICIGN